MRCLTCDVELISFFSLSASDRCNSTRVQEILKNPMSYMDCPRCPITLGSKSAWIPHLREKHDPSHPRIKCELCASTFSHVENYRRHRQHQHHLTLPIHYDLECPVCYKKNLKRLHNLQQHLRVCQTL